MPNIASVLRKNCKTLKFNNQQLQSDSSSVCGHFCLMFLYYMSFGIELQTFFGVFSENLHSNDKIVELFVENLRRRKKKILETRSPSLAMLKAVGLCVCNAALQNKGAYKRRG